MLGRRLWVKSVFAAVVAYFPGRFLVGPAVAQEGLSTNSATRLTEQNLTSLEEQLKKGLRVVTPEQLDYVKTVVELVDKGKLPRGLVNLVYKWSIERNPRVPFPYFQFALRELAKRRGVHIP